jgi:hypothetical protein
LRRTVFLLLVILLAARDIFLPRDAVFLEPFLDRDADLVFAFFRRFLAMRAPSFF